MGVTYVDVFDYRVGGRIELGEWTDLSVEGGTHHAGRRRRTPSHPLRPLGW